MVSSDADVQFLQFYLLKLQIDVTLVSHRNCVLLHILVRRIWCRSLLVQWLKYTALHLCIVLSYQQWCLTCDTYSMAFPKISLHILWGTISKPRLLWIPTMKMLMWLCITIHCLLLFLCACVCFHLLSSRQCLSSDDCLEDKKSN